MSCGGVTVGSWCCYEGHGYREEPGSQGSGIVDAAISAVSRYTLKNNPIEIRKIHLKRNQTSMVLGKKSL